MNVLAYHGSDYKFDEFSFHKAGESHGLDAGFGLYFSESKADALGYGNIVYTCMLQLKNNLSNEKITIKLDMYKAIVEDLYKNYGVSYYENFGYESHDEVSDLIKNKLIREDLSSSQSDTEIIGGLINGLFGGQCDKMLETLNRFGFSHTTDKRTPEDKTITHYIIYDLEAIKIQKIEEPLKIKK